MSTSPLPPGWPPEIRPPGTADWERSAVAWLLDLCPPEYRAYAVIARHPVVLAWLAGRHTEAQRNGVRTALSAVRTSVGDQMSPPALHEFIEVLETEQARLIASHRATALVESALRGHRYVPRL